MAFRATSIIPQDGYERAKRHAVWARGQWQTASDSPWTSGGIAQKPEHQNVLRFGNAPNVNRSVSALSWSKVDDTLWIEMDLSPAVGQLWKRSVEWRQCCNALHITDLADPTAEFGFEKPSADDDRAPYDSSAEAIVQPVADGFRSVVRW